VTTGTIRIIFFPLVIPVLLAGCAAPKAGHVPSADPAATGPRREAARLQTAQREAEARLDELQADAAPDCPRACELQGVICDLSRRICLIADRHRDDQELRGRCQDATRRCQRTNDKVSARCTCTPPGVTSP